MKEDMKTVLFMGLGALAEANDKMGEIKDSLYSRGKELYEKGVIANEELKHNINKAMKENVTVVNVHANTNKEDILNSMEHLSEEGREALMAEINKKGWNDVKHEKERGSKES